MQKCPFPGMDPYLEASWGDLHHRFITYSCDQIQSQLPPDLRARTGERVSGGSRFHTESRGIIPDVQIVERTARGTGAVAVLEAPADLAEPVYIEDVEPVTEGYIEIIDLSGQHVVTVIEVLSLTNKLPGEDRRKFMQKRLELVRGGTNIVEIDLLRRGRQMPPLRDRYLPPKFDTPYGVLTRRPWKSMFEYYRIPLREHLPKIPIPLRQTDRDVVLDLQAVFDQAYVNGRYDDTDYSRDAKPKLKGDDAAWVDKLLREAGRRKP